MTLSLVNEIEQQARAEAMKRRQDGPIAVTRENKPAIDRSCVEIADRVVPDFRGKRKSCTSQAARKWQAAYDAAKIALVGEVTL